MNQYKAGEIIFGGVSQLLLNYSQPRVGLFIQNISQHPLWLSDTDPAVQDSPSINIPANSTFSLEYNSGASNPWYIVGNTTGQKFTYKDW